jgi:RNA polymerase sigma factor (sigma-70 family)
MLAIMSDVTRLLDAAAAGDRQAAADLLPLVYDELRQLAAARMAREAPGHTLDATALVHEAYLRLVGNPKSEARNPKSEQSPASDFGFRASDFPRFAGRGHFFAAAAEAMRRILVESARRKRSHKRGGPLRRQPIDPADLAAPESSADLLALDEALDKLAATDPQAAELVKLRYFAGLTIPQAAAALGVSPRTADAWWAYARVWLLAELGG